MTGIARSALHAMRQPQEVREAQFTEKPEIDPFRYFQMRRRTVAIVEMFAGRITVNGVENVPPTPTVNAVPHQSAKDIPPFALTRPNHVLVQLARTDFVGGYLNEWMHTTAAMGIDRSGKDFRSVLRKTRQIVQGDGHSVGLFPSGTRDLSAPLRPGVHMIARYTNAPILPAAIHYGPRSEGVTVEIGEPFEPARDSEATLGQLATALTELFEEAGGDPGLLFTREPTHPVE